MKVHELIEALNKQEPDALVVIDGPGLTFTTCDNVDLIGVSPNDCYEVNSNGKYCEGKYYICGRKFAAVYLSKLNDKGKSRATNIIEVAED